MRKEGAVHTRTAERTWFLHQMTCDSGGGTWGRAAGTHGLWGLGFAGGSGWGCDVGRSICLLLMESQVWGEKEIDRGIGNQSTDVLPCSACAQTRLMQDSTSLTL